MTIDLVPLKQFSDRIAKGWRMVPGYPLEPGDYVVTMMSPGHETVMRSNKSRGASSRNRSRTRSPENNQMQDVG